MGLEYDLSDTKSEERENLRLELSPRHKCEKYVWERGGKATLVTKEEFDAHLNKENFVEGPFKDDFGDGWNEPYNPNRQAFGTLKTGVIVYCELFPENVEKTKKLLGMQP